MEKVYRTGSFLLPAPGVDMSKYPIVACDQYTSEPEKWEQAAALVGTSPSALRLILPECYLKEAAQRVPVIQETMREYLKKGILTEQVHDGFVLTERTTQSGVRPGLVILIDLDAYDYARDSASPIRPTEGTIVDRIPPRLEVRRGAPLELSHVLLLFDDPSDSLIGPLYNQRSSLRKLYDTDLMLSGGHLAGWAVEGEALQAALDTLDGLGRGKKPGDILFASGDGNHSLATAKAYWEEVKQTLPESARADHPARFASVELVNIYCPALSFEPIHRVVFHTGLKEILSCLAPAGPVRDADAPDVILISAEGECPLRFTSPLHPLPVGTVQSALDQQGGFDIDYVHGGDAVRRLALSEGTVGILVPPMRKDGFFDAVRPGPLPRKTFSMGEANEKRYYMEGRLITDQML